MVTARINVEPNHAADKVLAHSFFPSSLRATQCDFNFDLIFSFKLEQELRIIQPGLCLDVLNELFIVDMGTTRRLICPSSGDDTVHSVLELLHFNWLAAEDYI